MFADMAWIPKNSNQDIQMNNTEYISSFSKDETRLIREFTINGVVVQVWQEVNAMPPERATILLSPEKKVLLAVTDDGKVKEAIRILKLQKKDLETFLEIFEYIALHDRVIIDKIEYSYQEKIKNIWHEPKMVNNDFIFFVDNEAEGVLEKFVIKDLKDTEIVPCAKTIGIALK